MEPGSSGQIAIALVLLMFGILFSMSETALTSLSKVAVRQMKEDGKKRAALVERLFNNKERVISSLLIGNNLVTIIMSAIVTTLALNIASYENEALVLTVATAITSFLVIIFGDITPKVLASKDPSRISHFVALPTSWLLFILSPLSLVLNKVLEKTFSFFGPKDVETEKKEKEQELISYLEIAHEEGIIEKEESQMMGAVFGLRESEAAEIMTPRVEIVAIGIDYSYEAILEVFKTEKFSRIPVYEESVDNIVGVLNFKDFIFCEQNNFKIESLMRPPLFCIEHQSTDKLFAQMKEAGAGLAVVLDEYGGTAGLITMEDLVETIVGDIFDEYDQEDIEKEGEEIVCIVEGTEYLVQGSARIEEVNEFLNLKLASEDYDTISGYVVELFGYIPTAGEAAAFESISFIVESMERNRIGDLRIKIENEDTEEAT